MEILFTEQEAGYFVSVPFRGSLSKIGRRLSRLDFYELSVSVPFRGSLSKISLDVAIKVGVSIRVSVPFRGSLSKIETGWI